MICPPCKEAGRMVHYGMGTILQYLWQPQVSVTPERVAEAHEKCTAKTTCTCQHKILPRQEQQQSLH